MIVSRTIWHDSTSQGKSEPIWWGFDSQVDDDEVGWHRKQDDPAAANLRWASTPISSQHSDLKQTWYLPQASQAVLGVRK